MRPVNFAISGGVMFVMTEDGKIYQRDYSGAWHETAQFVLPELEKKPAKKKAKPA